MSKIFGRLPEHKTFIAVSSLTIVNFTIYFGSIFILSKSLFGFEFHERHVVLLTLILVILAVWLCLELSKRAQILYHSLLITNLHSNDCASNDCF